MSGTPLDDVEGYLTRFVSYPSASSIVAHVLWVAHAHRMDLWESTPRIAFLSPEPGSGKTRALEATEPLVPRPIHSVNTTPAYLFRKVSDEAGPPTILYDEIDTVFGPRAKENEDLRGMLNSGHRRGATAGRCVIKGRQIETEELPAYCAVALAGLDDLPDTLSSRSVIVRMRRRAPDEVVEAFRHRLHLPAGALIRDRVAKWMADMVVNDWPEMPDGVADRNADIWEPLIAVADYAAGAWPDRARAAAVALVADSLRRPQSLGLRLLADLRSLFVNVDKLSTESVLAELVAMDEAPWGDLRGKQLDSIGLSRRLAKYDIGPKNIRIDKWVGKGYNRSDFVDAWRRYLADAPYTAHAKPATSATPVTAQVNPVADLDPVADVAATGISTATPLTSEVADVAAVAGNSTPPDAEPPNGSDQPQKSRTILHAAPTPLDLARRLGPRCAGCGDPLAHRYGVNGNPLCDTCQGARMATGARTS